MSNDTCLLGHRGLGKPRAHRLDRVSTTVLAAQGPKYLVSTTHGSHYGVTGPR